MRETYSARPRLRSVACLLLCIIMLGGFSQGAETYSDRYHFGVRLISPTTPRRVMPGVTHITLAAIGFHDGILEPKDVAISFTPIKPEYGPTASIHPISV